MNILTRVQGHKCVCHSLIAGRVLYLSHTEPATLSGRLHFTRSAIFITVLLEINFTFFPAMKEYWKSVTISKSYGQNPTPPFCRHTLILSLNSMHSIAGLLSDRSSLCNGINTDHSPVTNDLSVTIDVLIAISGSMHAIYIMSKNRKQKQEDGHKHVLQRVLRSTWERQVVNS